LKIQREKWIQSKTTQIKEPHPKSNQNYYLLGKHWDGLWWTRWLRIGHGHCVGVVGVGVGGRVTGSWHGQGEIVVIVLIGHHQSGRHVWIARTAWSTTPLPCKSASLLGHGPHVLHVADEFACVITIIMKKLSESCKTLKLRVCVIGRSQPGKVRCFGGGREMSKMRGFFIQGRFFYLNSEYRRNFSKGGKRFGSHKQFTTKN
jgi:hypothetical protein